MMECNGCYWVPRCWCCANSSRRSCRIIFYVISTLMLLGEPKKTIRKLNLRHVQDVQLRHVMEPVKGSDLAKQFLTMLRRIKYSLESVRTTFGGHRLGCGVCNCPISRNIQSTLAKLFEGNISY